MRLLRSGLVLAVLGVGLMAPQAQAATHTGNLIKNGGGEAAVASTDGTPVPTPKWKLGTGTGFTAVQYGASGGFPTATDPGPAKRGSNFLAGGPDGDVVVTETAKVATYATAIDQGTVTYTLIGWLGGYSSQGDEAFLEVDFKDANGALLDSASIGPVTAADRANVTGLLKRTKKGSVPVGTRSIFIQLSMTRLAGTYNDGYADGLSLKLFGV
jgi:hypothetical protein